VNLAQAGGVVVTGDLTAGDFVNLTIGLGDGAAAGEDQCAVESPAGEE
jgi:hypothetical protein